MFTAKIEVKDLDKMDAEYRELLGRVLTIQADCEIGGPHLYVERMLPQAPTRLDQLIVARTAAEEVDHFRKVARVAGDMGVDVSFVLSQPNEKRFVDSFRGLITTWEDNAVFGFLIDRVGRYQLEEFYDCSYLPLQRIFQWRDPQYHDKNTEMEEYATYRPVDGIQTPYTITRSKNGEEVRQFFVTDAKYNQDLGADFWDPDAAAQHIEK